MYRFVGVLMVVLLLTSSLMAGSTASTDDNKALTIKWQRLIDKSGKTCDLCGVTEVELQKAVDYLKRQGVQVELATTEKTVKDFSKDCQEANRVWINNVPLEKVLDAKVTKTSCSSTCAMSDKESKCWGLKVDDQTYQTVPAELVAMAGLKTLSMPYSDIKISGASKTGCSMKCMKTCGAKTATGESKGCGEKK